MKAWELAHSQMNYTEFSCEQFETKYLSKFLSWLLRCYCTQFCLLILLPLKFAYCYLRVLFLFFGKPL